MGDRFSWLGQSGSWGTAANWFNETTGASADHAPTFGDTAAFLAGTYAVTGGGSASEIDLAAGAQASFAGTSGETYGAVRLDIGAGARLAVQDSVLLVGPTSIDHGGILDLTEAPPGSGLPQVPGSASFGDLVLAGPGADGEAGGTLVLGGDTAVVNGAVKNGNSGVGNDFDARAGILGSGTLLQAPFSDHPEVRVLRDGHPVTSLDFGTVHVGDGASLHFTLVNFAGNAGGPPAQGAIQTLINGGSVTDPALSGSGITPQNFLIGGRGGAADFTVALDTGQPHDLTGQAVHIAYQFNHGLFDVGDTLPITGHVVADQPAPVDWDALAAAVQAAFAATGSWYVPAAFGQPAPGPVDWDALAARVQANFAETGQWFA